MALVTLKKILDGANEGGYAVPAFDALDHASADAIVETAMKKNRPVILMVPEVGFGFVDTNKFFDYLVGIAKNATVPVAVMLDHGQTLEAVMTAIHHGFSGVMIDGSSLPYEENVALTKRIVEIAHAAGISVEAEIGHVAGGEGDFGGSDVDESMYTNLEDARRFTAETGVDALAIAFGTVHGVYKGTPKLDLQRLAAIKEAVKIPLVMHGGSGVADEDFIKAKAAGINKINYFTEISMAAVANSVVYSQKKENKLHFAELIMAAKATVSERVGHYLELVGEQ